MTEYVYEYAFPVPLLATREQAFEALTSEQALKVWFAEHAQIGAEVGGPFRFWGCHTYGVPTAEQATQSLLRLEPPAVVSFSWRLLDRDSVVTWQLEEERTDDGVVTKITVSHVFPSIPDIGRAAELIDDLWRIHTGNLCFYLKGDSEAYRPDFANPDPEVRCEVTIDAPPARVFAALIEPEKIKQWFPAPAPVVDPRVGGDYGFGFSFEQDGKTIAPPPMKILEFVENERLTITWPDWRMNPEVPDQRVTWLLEDLGGRTRLVLLHTGFTRAVDVSDYPFGWQQFLDQIGSVAAA